MARIEHQMGVNSSGVENRNGIEGAALKI